MLLKTNAEMFLIILKSQKIIYTMRSINANIKFEEFVTKSLKIVTYSLFLSFSCVTQSIKW